MLSLTSGEMDLWWVLPVDDTAVGRDAVLLWLVVSSTAVVVDLLPVVVVDFVSSLVDSEVDVRDVAGSPSVIDDLEITELSAVVGSIVDFSVSTMFLPLSVTVDLSGAVISVSFVVSIRSLPAVLVLPVVVELGVDVRVGALPPVWSPSTSTIFSSSPTFCIRYASTSGTAVPACRTVTVIVVSVELLPVSNNFRVSVLEALDGLVRMMVVSVIPPVVRLIVPLLWVTDGSMECLPTVEAKLLPVSDVFRVSVLEAGDGLVLTDVVPVAPPVVRLVVPLLPVTDGSVECLPMEEAKLLPVSDVFRVSVLPSRVSDVGSPLAVNVV